LYAYLIEALGWRGALHVAGALTAVVLLGTAPFFSVPPLAQKSAAVAAKPWRLPCVDVRYLCWWMNQIFCFLSYFAPVALLADFAVEELGARPEEAALAYTMLGASALATRAVLGFLTELCGGTRRVHFASQALNSLMQVALPYCWNTKALLAWSVVYGLSVGPVIALISVILSELFGIESLPVLHGTSRLAVGLGTLVGPPMISRLVTLWGYRPAFLLGGLIEGTGLVFLTMLAVLQARHESRQVGPKMAKEGGCDPGAASPRLGSDGAV